MDTYHKFTDPEGMHVAHTGINILILILTERQRGKCLQSDADYTILASAAFHVTLDRYRIFSGKTIHIN